MLKRFTLLMPGVLVCAGLAAAPAGAQDKPQQEETKVIIKDDTTPKIKKGTQVVSDVSVTTAVKTRLMTDKVARSTAIAVDTKDRVVTIAGSVPTETDKARIGRLVARTTGVKSVENNLTVTGEAVAGTTGADQQKPDAEGTTIIITDASITSAVKTRLMADDLGRALQIDVDTKDAVVTITGTVPTDADKTRLNDIVAHTTGVKSVVNNLTVK